MRARRGAEGRTELNASSQKGWTNICVIKRWVFLIVSTKRACVGLCKLTRAVIDFENTTISYVDLLSNNTT